MHQHATWGSEAALAGVDSVGTLNVFGQLAPKRSRWPSREAHAVRIRRLALAMVRRSRSARRPRAPAVRRADRRRHGLDPTLVLYAARPGALDDDVGDTSMDDPERTRLLPLLPPPVSKELVARWPSVARRPAARRRPRGARRVARGQHARDRGRLPSRRRRGPGGDRLPRTSRSFQATRCIASSSSWCARALADGGDHFGDTAPGERLARRDVFGTIAPGRSADLPCSWPIRIADIRNVRRIERVIVRGVASAPETLLAGLPKS